MKKSPRIVFAASHPKIRGLMWNEAAQQKARNLGFEVRMPPLLPKKLTMEEWKEFFADAEAILTTWGSPRLDEEILRFNTSLRFVGHAAGSVSGIVSPFLFNSGIPVSSSNRNMAEAVARWCLMMTLLGLRNILASAQFGSGNRIDWDRRGLDGEPNHGVKDIPNATIGIWGYGDISKRLIELLRPFRPKELLICSRSLPAAEAQEKGMRKVSLEELFAQSDLLHTLQGLTEQTRGAVKAEHLASMKKQAVLINGGRAHLIEEEAFYQELRRNRITAILDVFHEEPIPDHNPLHGMSNVIMTPHIAGFDGCFQYVPLMLEELDRLLNGEPLLFQISPERARLMTDSSQRR